MKIIVGLSGGVDSSVAAHRLLELGHTVEGLFMKNWDEDDGTAYCTAKEDLAIAQRVAEHLGITLHCANFAAEYWDRVFEYFLGEYRAYRTPNPDILCNSEIKFNVFLDYAKTLGADCIATGHYARIINIDNIETASRQSRSVDVPWLNAPPQHALYQGLDPNKDQSYFLHALSAEQLAHSVFPLGDLAKTAVRAEAKRIGLPNFDRKDSTGICFIGERRFQDFLARFCPKEPGEIWTSEGERIGEHHGLAYYTIGQRQGLRIGGLKSHDEGAWYVADKIKAHNRLIVAQGTNHPALFAQELVTDTPHWIHPIKLSHHEPLRCHAKIRYRQQNQPCKILLLDQDSDLNIDQEDHTSSMSHMSPVSHATTGTTTRTRLRVIFDEPQRAITPGQFVVFYQEACCLGGAKIDRALKSTDTPSNHMT
ncbi:MAG: tRNA 2-thiouridine(34) synthase MnmA [Gammaproteobacteria bacterium]